MGVAGDVNVAAERDVRAGVVTDKHMLACGVLEVIPGHIQRIDEATTCHPVNQNARLRVVFKTIGTDEGRGISDGTIRLNINADIV